MYSEFDSEYETFFEREILPVVKGYCPQIATAQRRLSIISVSHYIDGEVHPLRGVPKVGEFAVVFSNGKWQVHSGSFQNFSRVSEIEAVRAQRAARKAAEKAEQVAAAAKRKEARAEAKRQEEPIKELLRRRFCTSQSQKPLVEGGPSAQALCFAVQDSFDIFGTAMGNQFVLTTFRAESCWPEGEGTFQCRVTRRADVAGPRNLISRTRALRNTVTDLFRKGLYGYWQDAMPPLEYDFYESFQCCGFGDTGAGLCNPDGLIDPFTGVQGSKKRIVLLSWERFNKAQARIHHQRACVEGNPLACSADWRPKE